MRIDKFPISDDTYSSNLISSSSSVIIMQLYHENSMFCQIVLFVSSWRFSALKTRQKAFSVTKP